MRSSASSIIITSAFRFSVHARAEHGNVIGDIALFSVNSWSEDEARAGSDVSEEGDTPMVHKRMVSLVAATVIGAALIAAPTLAAGRGGGRGFCTQVRAAVAQYGQAAVVVWGASEGQIARGRACLL
jgi:hypothetical protein